MKRVTIEKRRELIQSALKENPRLSSRKISALLWDRHGMKIDYSTVARDMQKTGRPEKQIAKPQQEPIIPWQPPEKRATEIPPQISSYTPQRPQQEMTVNLDENPNAWKSPVMPDYALDQRKLEAWRLQQLAAAPKPHWQR